jgi:hypothetical protein
MNSLKLLHTAGRRAAVVTAGLALLGANWLPAHAASAAPALAHAALVSAQVSVKDLALTHRVPGTCTPTRCR